MINQIEDYCLLSDEVGEAWGQFHNDAEIERWFHETFYPPFWIAEQERLRLNELGREIYRKAKDWHIEPAGEWDNWVDREGDRFGNPGTRS